MARDKSEVTLQGVHMIYKNFTGKGTPYNKEGDRNFCVLLDDETAEQLEKNGWNIKYTKPRDPDDIAEPYIKVIVNYKGDTRDPRIVFVTRKNRTGIPEDLCSMTDRVNYSHIDVTFSPYDWRRPDGRSGRSAYLQTLIVVQREDMLLQKYEHLEEINARGELAAPREQLAITSGEPDYIEGEVVSDSDESDEDRAMRLMIEAGRGINER